MHRVNVETKWYTVVLVIIGIRNLQPIYNCHLMYHHAINDNTLQSIALSPDTTDNIIRIFCISSAKNTWVKSVFGRLKVTKWFSLGPLPQSPPNAWSADDTWQGTTVPPYHDTWQGSPTWLDDTWQGTAGGSRPSSLQSCGSGGFHPDRDRNTMRQIWSRLWGNCYIISFPLPVGNRWLATSFPIIGTFPKKL